jgi:hypothetical protein
MIQLILFTEREIDYQTAAVSCSLKNLAHKPEINLLKINLLKRNLHFLHNLLNKLKKRKERESNPKELDDAKQEKKKLS